MSLFNSITPADVGRNWVLYRVFHQCWLQRQLFLKLLRRDFAERYRGSYLGLLWSLLLPLLSLLVFTFFFGVIFQMRWAGRSDASLSDLALILFVGMALYNFLAECLNRAPGLILAHQNYVKNVVFPLEMLPAVMVASAVLTLAATLLVILLLQATLGSGLSWTALLLPMIVLPLMLFVLGLSGFLASLGVYIRDIQQLIIPLVQLMMFLSPVFYPAAALPEAMRPWLQLNPLALAIEQTRGILLFGQAPDWTPYLLSLVAGGLIALLGAWWFARTRRGFADVL
ncbi:MAG TPA: ABC transporter permease [Candidatus Competibacteraceae bacterium]|nr:ABC transporter permease [Candidatus Competibacteraceae bacterium]HRZ06462.1 ABC transporter permease [Candidatus Competibacteraceae bacterium]HSA45135.1 ABC transporter permease [Candidatus Competibacteraceae bacterium]